MPYVTREQIETAIPAPLLINALGDNRDGQFKQMSNVKIRTYFSYIQLPAIYECA